MFPQVNVAEISDKIITSEEMTQRHCKSCKYCEKIIHNETMPEDDSLNPVKNAFNNYFCIKNLSQYENSFAFVIDGNNSCELLPNGECPGK